MWTPPVRSFLLVFGLAFLPFVTVVSPGSDYTEPYRPQFHFSPPTNWMNDPNGLVFYDGEFHLFYQFNPFADLWGHMSWGHAVSTDLVTWKHLAVALQEEGGVMVFSGSAVVDWNNTSGLGQPGKPPLVAVYTGHTDTRQNQNLAFSLDRGRTWRKYPGNPVLDIGQKDFRDPKVLWHSASRQWIMVVALPVQRQVLFFGSPDLIRWKRLGEFGPAGAVFGVWECPDLFELPVLDGTPKTKWVLIVSTNPGGVAGGSGTQYFVGDFDGESFRAEQPTSPRWADYGPDFYAAVSWSDVPPSDGRRLWIGWMNNWEYADKIPTSPWRGAMSLPRELVLRHSEDGLRLIQRPVAELRKLRGEHLSISRSRIPDANRTLETFRGELLEIEAELDVGSAKELGISLPTGEGQKTRAGYAVVTRNVYVNRSFSGQGSFHPAFRAWHGAPLALKEGRVRLHIFVDRSSIEVFANEGERVITALIFPEAGTKGIELYEEAGEAELRHLDIWRLRSAVAPGSPP